MHFWFRRFGLVLVVLKGTRRLRTECGWFHRTFISGGEVSGPDKRDPDYFVGRDFVWLATLLSLSLIWLTDMERCTQRDHI